MVDKNPKVSIGLPVFNGEHYLKEAIDSILAQTFTNFELVIIDNASTDRTEEICKEYLARDSRIRYYRNPTNIGGVKNENRTFELSRGQYFRIAAHDDVLALDLIEKCVRVLDNDESIILCDSNIVYIDRDGKHLQIVEQSKANSSDSVERFKDILCWDHSCEANYGLMRANIVRKTELQPLYRNSDRMWLAELSLSGKFYRIPEPLFFSRFHTDKASYDVINLPQLMRWCDPELESKLGEIFHSQLLTNLVLYFLCYLRNFFHSYRVISRSSLSVKERILCYRHYLNYVIPDLVNQLASTSLSKRLGRGKLRKVKSFFNLRTYLPQKNVDKGDVTI